MKYSVILGNLGNTCDRFLSTGYKQQPSKAQMVRQAASIPGVSAVELVENWDVTAQNVSTVRRMLKDNGLACSSIIPDLFSNKRWGSGSFTARNTAIRRKAVDAVKQAMDLAAQLSCKTINLWPGQDGYDYCFQGDFVRAHDWLLDGIIACANHDRAMNVALEYKCKEPRTHSYFARAADTLLFALETGCPNVGVTIDTGHAMAAGENMAEAASLLLRADKLFHLHFNDNYRSWDDDMIVGTVHFVEYVELLYWLNRLGYKGWYSMDQYPYREDARGALNGSVRFIAGLWKKMQALGLEKFDQAVRDGKAVDMSTLIRNLLGMR
ncbi:MAG: xylose isomerase [Lentisphaerae bacterium RIFOXYC12_FULL_60_16]|nr:MAG: xylose isomerase [Lentisphaerae bacterium RIFOXYC12_FULL_60_16]OGV71266.1 MAG: xylose isomerase [Lentisphaerae bacterium RIFOXYA12_FULL_60_10]OGV84162.1 MAG: xylose isomerase [Lentisphaerae bacterium RIFOXYB12_FULL_60_10]